MDNDEEPEFLVSKANGMEQHFYVNGEVTFDIKPNVNANRLLITGLQKPDAILVMGGGFEDTLVNITGGAVWVMSIPEEVKADSLNADRVAPYRIKDEYDYNDDVLYWDYQDAVTNARLWAEENEADCQVVNAYNNDLEYIEYEEPEEEDEEEEEDDDSDD